MTAIRLRAAGPDDAEGVASLHAASWRRHYRGAYSDAYLDGDVLADRRAVWSSRLAGPEGTATVVAEDAAAACAGVVGFVHVVFGSDERWGSLVDNLHVAYGRQRGGVGTALLVRAAEAVAERAAGGGPLHLWVLEQNTAAQGFYRALGGTRVERAPVPPEDRPDRLNGSPAMLRFVWDDATALAAAGLQRARSGR
jgi:ribosomal protein S18 acetylase RimI-like enzyme